MTVQKLTIEECVEAILDEMSKLGHQPSTIVQYRSRFNRFIKYCKKQNEVYFTERLAVKYLDDVYGIKLTDFADEQVFHKHKTMYLRAMKLLGQYNRDQTFSVRFSRYYKPIEQHEFWFPLYEAFMNELSHRDITPSTIRRKEFAIRNAIEYFLQKNIQSEQQISMHVIDGLVSTFIAKTPKSFSHEIGNLKEFFRFLYHEKKLSFNIEGLIPDIKQPHYASIPASWEAEDIQKILNAIDRGSPVGKRDYAMILLACRLGLRSSDIINLSLDHLNWETKEIRLYQRKTGNFLVLPLLKDVGWALIDYLKNGRPVTGSKKVFIRHQPPFVGTMDSTNMNRIFTKAIHVAGLSIPKGKPCGIHSLRHTLGRILLENEVSLPVIAGVLGHQTIKSTETYLKINIEKLFQCPLNPEEVFNE